MKAFNCTILTAMILAWLCSCHHKEARAVKHELELTAQPGGIIYLDTTPTIHVSTTLYNPTEDTLSFVSMSCSYEDMFCTDTSTFKVQSRYDCFSNYPIVIAIPPHTKLDQYIMVRPANKDIKAFDKKIRIGMYYIIPKKENGFEGIKKHYEDRKKAERVWNDTVQRSKVLWSNELDLGRLYRKMYK